MTYGQITLTGIRAHANHGVLASERELGQPFSVDVSLDVDMDTVSDDLTQAVNYATVAQRVLNILTREPVSLIETLGSNMGDPFAHLRDAVRLIAETPGIHDVVVSPVYVTAPIGGVEQDDFLNLIVVATSDLPPSVLLERAHVIEAAHGRDHKQCHRCYRPQ